MGQQQGPRVAGQAGQMLTKIKVKSDISHRNVKNCTKCGYEGILNLSHLLTSKKLVFAELICRAKKHVYHYMV